MKYTALALLLFIGLLLHGCDKDGGLAGLYDYADVDYTSPESVIKTYYKALFVNDTATAYGLIWERDRWFVFDDEFGVKYRVNAFIYPELVADKFALELLEFKQDENTAEVNAQITAPDLTLLTDTVCNRLFDVSMPPLGNAELKALVLNANWQFYQTRVKHRLLFEDGRWYIYYDFETMETVAEFLRQAERLLDTRDALKIEDAREKYNAALALSPGSEKARSGLMRAEAKLASIDDAKAYIRENMELFDFNSQNYNILNDGSPVPGVTFKILNKGDRDVVKIMVRITFYSAGGHAIASEVVDPLAVFTPKEQTPLLKAGATWRFAPAAYYRSSSRETSWHYKWQAGQAKAEIEDVIFADEM